MRYVRLLPSEHPPTPQWDHTIIRSVCAGHDFPIHDADEGVRSGSQASLPVVDELELDTISFPSARLGTLRRLGGGRDVGGGEDGMSKAAARRCFVPTASWGRKE